MLHGLVKWTKAKFVVILKVHYFPWKHGIVLLVLLEETLCSNIETIFPNIKNDGTDFIYTTLTGNVEGFTPLTINLSTENKDFAKAETEIENNKKWINN